MKNTSGLTLIEVTLAVGIFAVVIAASAQAILSFYVANDIQQDRIAAGHACRALMGHVRDMRGEFRGANEADLVDWQAYINWVDTQNSTSWQSYTVGKTGTKHLKNLTLQVELYNMNGAAATAADNPIEVHTVAQWTDAKGRQLNSRVVSRITDR